MPNAPRNGDPVAPIHRIPPRGSLVYPCCGREMFEIPRADRTTWVDAQVTCVFPPEGGRTPTPNAEKDAQREIHRQDCHPWQPAVTLTNFLLARIAEDEEAASRGPFLDATGACAFCGKPAPCKHLRILALPYADHPDYDETWRP